MRKIYILLIPVAMIITSCGSARLSFDVLAPAPIYIPDDINTIAIVNRSLPSNKDLNLLEGILSGEGLEQDTLATKYVLDGLFEVLQSSPRFKATKTKESFVGSGIGNILPEPLSPQTVAELCSRYNADAIIALEAYDSDLIIGRVSSAGIRLLEMKAQGSVTVNCGFRMYHSDRQGIIDEFMFGHETTWGSGELSILAAANAIINRKEAVRQASYDAGLIYGERIIPNWIYVSRDYYKKGNYDLEEGARMMQLNEWDKAITALERALESGDRKSKGRAAHNLAIVYEILGDLHSANEWASVAWGRYKEKKSRSYGYILKRRMEEQELLNRQLRQ